MDGISERDCDFFFMWVGSRWGSLQRGSSPSIWDGCGETETCMHAGHDNGMVRMWCSGGVP